MSGGGGEKMEMGSVGEPKSLLKGEPLLAWGFAAPPVG